MMRNDYGRRCSIGLIDKRFQLRARLGVQSGGIFWRNQMRSAFVSDVDLFAGFGIGINQGARKRIIAPQRGADESATGDLNRIAIQQGDAVSRGEMSGHCKAIFEQAIPIFVVAHDENDRLVFRQIS